MFAITSMFIIATTNGRRISLLNFSPELLVLNKYLRGWMQTATGRIAALNASWADKGTLTWVNQLTGNICAFSVTKARCSRNRMTTVTREGLAGLILLTESNHVAISTVLSFTGNTVFAIAGMSILTILAATITIGFEKPAIIRMKEFTIDVPAICAISAFHFVALGMTVRAIYHGWAFCFLWTPVVFVIELTIFFIAHGTILTFSLVIIWMSAWAELVRRTLQLQPAPFIRMSIRTILISAIVTFAARSFFKSIGLSLTMRSRLLLWLLLPLRLVLLLE